MQFTILVLLKHSFQDQLTQDNKSLTKAKADNSEFASSLEAERADLAEAEKRLGGCCSRSFREGICGGVEGLADAAQVHKSDTAQTLMDLHDGKASRPEATFCRSLLACISAC